MEYEMQRKFHCGTQNQAQIHFKIKPKQFVELQLKPTVPEMSRCVDDFHEIACVEISVQTGN